MVFLLLKNKKFKNFKKKGGMEALELKQYEHFVFVFLFFFFFSLFFQEWGTRLPTPITPVTQLGLKPTSSPNPTSRLSGLATVSEFTKTS